MAEGGATTPASLQLSPLGAVAGVNQGTPSRHRRLFSGVRRREGHQFYVSGMTTITANRGLNDAAHIISHTNIDPHTAVCVGHAKHVRYWSNAVH